MTSGPGLEHQSEGEARRPKDQQSYDPDQYRGSVDGNKPKWLGEEKRGGYDYSIGISQKIKGGKPDPENSPFYPGEN
jgi:hypothetical protein